MVLFWEYKRDKVCVSSPRGGVSEPAALVCYWWRQAGLELCDGPLLSISGGSSLPVHTAHTATLPPGKDEG